MKEFGSPRNTDVVSETASDLVSNHVGESQTKTSHIIAGDCGKVLTCTLTIDDVYST